MTSPNIVSKTKSNEIDSKSETEFHTLSRLQPPSQLFIDIDNTTFKKYTVEQGKDGCFVKLDNGETIPWNMETRIKKENLTQLTHLINISPTYPVVSKVIFQQHIKNLANIRNKIGYRCQPNNLGMAAFAMEDINADEYIPYSCDIAVIPKEQVVSSVYGVELPLIAEWVIFATANATKRDAGMFVQHGPESNQIIHMKDFKEDEQPEDILYKIISPSLTVDQVATANCEFFCCMQRDPETNSIVQLQISLRVKKDIKKGQMLILNYNLQHFIQSGFKPYCFGLTGEIFDHTKIDVAAYLRLTANNGDRFTRSIFQSEIDEMLKVKPFSFEIIQVSDGSVVCYTTGLLKQCLEKEYTTKILIAVQHPNLRSYLSIRNLKEAMLNAIKTELQYETIFGCRFGFDKDNRVEVQSNGTRASNQFINNAAKQLQLDGYETVQVQGGEILTLFIKPAEIFDRMILKLSHKPIEQTEVSKEVQKTDDLSEIENLEFLREALQHYSMLDTTVPARHTASSSVNETNSFKTDSSLAYIKK